MSSHVYHEIYLHLNWHVKENHPALRNETEELTHTLIRQKCHEIKGVFFEDVGGTDDHIHLAVRIEPSVRISDMVQELKGYSSFEVNKRSARKLLEWQRGYGVVGFGKRNLSWVLAYIRNQREHHQRGTTLLRLEMCDAEEASPAEAG